MSAPHRRLRGEPGLAVTFDAAGEARAYDDLASLEACGGSRVTLTIAADHSVAVEHGWTY